MNQQTPIPLSVQIMIRKAIDDDLINLEWGGEYSHFRNLYREIYESSRKGDAILWIVDLMSVGVIGQLFVQLNSARKDLADGMTRAYIYGFRIHPQYRNRSIGSNLLQYVEVDLYRRGFLRVCLNVGRENIDARRLYDYKGYHIVGIESGDWSYLDDRGQRQYVHEPAWKMEKELARLGRLIDS